MSGKIFGIGIGRTGTSSLTSAMRILGYKSLHFVPNLNPVIIRKIDFVCDTPVPACYKDLDVQYPGSRFIYTTRKISTWLKSVKWLFKILGESPDGKMRLRAESYGSARFDPILMRKRFLEHNADIEEYFKNRPQDLLTLRICDGEGWEKLCSFLDKDIPDIPFPHKFKRGN